MRRFQGCSLCRTRFPGQGLLLLTKRQPEQCIRVQHLSLCCCSKPYPACGSCDCSLHLLHSSAQAKRTGKNLRKLRNPAAALPPYLLLAEAAISRQQQAVSSSSAFSRMSGRYLSTQQELDQERVDAATRLAETVQEGQRSRALRTQRCLLNHDAPG